MKASFFDIDGTLVKGFLISEFPKQLSEKSIFDKKLFLEIENWVKKYRKDKATYRKIALEIPKIYSSGMKGLEERDVKNEARKFVKVYLKKFIQPYTRDLVKLMKKYGMTIGISGSPIEVVSLVGKMFNFDLTYGSELEIKNGIYTGKMKRNMIIKEMKEVVLEKIIRQNKIDLNKSFGFGDTEQDMSILSKVKYPIALNPNKNLLKIVKSKGWMIFDSNNDIVKVLENSSLFD
jgi:HAD superfamily hydrolase (TIGR01490 family)